MTPQTDQGDSSPNGKRRGVPLLDVCRSVAAAFFGVQSSRNRERDFEQGRPLDYLIVGGIATIVFVLIVWGAVKLFLYLVLGDAA